MRKISYLLASVVSAITALASSAGMAMTTDPAPRGDSAESSRTSRADAVKVSEAAKKKIGTKIVPRKPSDAFDNAFKDGPKFGESAFLEHKLTPQSKTVKPAGDVKKQFQQNQPK
jgi:hypothetical protein